MHTCWDEGIANLSVVAVGIGVTFAIVSVTLIDVVTTLIDDVIKYTVAGILESEQSALTAEQNNMFRERFCSRGVECNVLRLTSMAASILTS